VSQVPRRASPRNSPSARWAQERLLSDLLGFGARAQHAERDAEDPVLVRGHQLLECPPVAGAQPGEQGGVVREPLTHD
jgi:hypothetical protein